MQCCLKVIASVAAGSTFLLSQPALSATLKIAADEGESIVMIRTNLEIFNQNRLPTYSANGKAIANGARVELKTGSLDKAQVAGGLATAAPGSDSITQSNGDVTSTATYDFDPQLLDEAGAKQDTLPVTKAKAILSTLKTTAKVTAQTGSGKAEMKLSDPVFFENFSVDSDFVEIEAILSAGTTFTVDGGSARLAIEGSLIESNSLELYSLSIQSNNTSLKNSLSINFSSNSLLGISDDDIVTAVLDGFNCLSNACTLNSDIILFSGELPVSDLLNNSNATTASFAFSHSVSASAAIPEPNTALASIAMMTLGAGSAFLRNRK